MDLWRCNMCKARFGGVPQIDHMLPLSLGGSSDQKNQQLLCCRCHQYKKDYLDDTQIKRSVQLHAEREIEPHWRQMVEKIQWNALPRCLGIDESDVLEYLAQNYEDGLVDCDIYIKFRNSYKQSKGEV